MDRKWTRRGQEDLFPGWQETRERGKNTYHCIIFCSQKSAKEWESTEKGGLKGENCGHPCPLCHFTNYKTFWEGHSREWVEERPWENTVVRNSPPHLLDCQLT